ncbi:hypothetical protein [Cupriavidus oxalaticus]|uniref:Uncharacterized protein n=1 Tax=Cupriavidus oxalaticus TaxID=96344 RepID=A0A4P7LHA3_9BURK|nr:hypothetical protein [Cupriavidus oxalaticus]QBY55526.1 hypothetical protein E0W60_31435 [Cupriavidus oxalaticus]
MMESHRRAGYYEFKAYTQPISNGKHQGFVLVRQHTLVGMQQSVFRAGRPSMAEADAFALAEARVDDLIVLIGSGRLPKATPVPPG